MGVSQLFPTFCARPRTIFLALQSSAHIVNKAKYVTFKSAPAFWPPPVPRTALAHTSLEPPACVDPPHLYSRLPDRRIGGRTAIGRRTDQ